jgi:transcriptional regulator of met regulon
MVNKKTIIGYILTGYKPSNSLFIKGDIMDTLVNQLMYNDRKLALINNWRQATQSGKLEEIYMVYMDIKQFVNEVTIDTTTPDEIREQVNDLLELMEDYIEEKNYTFCT